MNSTPSRDQSSTLLMDSLMPKELLYPSRNTSDQESSTWKENSVLNHGNSNSNTPLWLPNTALQTKQESRNSLTRFKPATRPLLPRWVQLEKNSFKRVQKTLKLGIALLCTQNHKKSTLEFQSGSDSSPRMPTNSLSKDSQFTTKSRNSSQEVQRPELVMFQDLHQRN